MESASSAFLRYCLFLCLGKKDRKKMEDFLLEPVDGKFKDIGVKYH